MAKRRVHQADTRLACIAMRKEGNSFGIISKTFNVPYQTVHNWVSNILIQGDLIQISPSIRCKTFDECNGKRTRKRCLIDERGRKCEICGLSEWLDKPIPLEIHHKDGHNQNWHKDNLLLCCPNCHSFTETYRGKNKGVKERSGRVAQLEEAQS